MVKQTQDSEYQTTSDWKEMARNAYSKSKEVAGKGLGYTREAYSKSGKTAGTSKDRSKIPIYGSATTAWRYLAQKPRTRLKKTQRYTRVLEARLKLMQERQRQKQMEAALRNKTGVTGTGLSQKSGFFVGTEEIQSREGGRVRIGFLGNSGGRAL